MKIIFSILISISIIFCSCEASRFGFIEPVPSNGKKLPSFENNVIGLYHLADTNRFMISETQTIVSDKTEDSFFDIQNTISITSDSINNSLIGQIFINKDSLAEKDKIDLFYNHGLDTDIINNIPKPVYFYEIDSNKNSYVIRITLRSNIFAISDSGVLIKSGGKYYMNAYQSASKNWYCSQLETSKKGKEISINTMTNDDIGILKRLIATESKNNKNYLLSPRIFKKFLKKGGFENKIKLNRIR